MSMDDLPECDSCGYQTALKPYQRGFPEQGEPAHLCDLCASTRAGNAQEYPRQYEGQTAILQTICYVGNAILDALKKRDVESGVALHRTEET